MAVNPVPTTNAQRSVLTDELADVRAKYNEETDPEMRQQHARNIIALSRTLNNKATDWAPSDNPDPNYEAQVETMDAGGKTGEQTVMVDGVPHYFPAEATEEQILAALTPAQPQASQADVRKAEPVEATPGKADWLNKINPVSRPGGLLSRAITAPFEALDAASNWVGGKATDLASGAGLSPNAAAGVGTVANLASQLPLALAGPAGPELRLEKALRYVGKDASDVTGTAVSALLNRTKDVIPTPGQISGQPSMVENILRSTNPGTFKDQAAELQKGAQGLAEDVLYPADQPSRTKLGQTIQQAAADAEEAVKTRLRPVFNAADAAGFNTNLQAVANRARAALAEDAATPGRKLEAGERGYLQSLVDDIEKTGKPAVPSQNVMSTVVGADGKPVVLGQTAGATAQPVQNTAAGTMDLLSTLKAKLRQTPEYKPTLPYERTIGDLTNLTDKAFTDAAQASGNGGLARDLMGARSDYRGMMATVNDGAVEKALKLNPEDVGRHFWQAGNVTEPGQLQRLLNLAQSEGSMTVGQARKLTGDVATGFLQEALPDLNAAANWTTKLQGNPRLRDTWNALTSAPGGESMKVAMEVLEKTAQIALKDSPSSANGNLIPLTRAAHGGVGYSAVTGTVHPQMMALNIPLVAIPKMLSTAYTHGNTGIINTITRVLRLSSVRNTAALRTAEPLVGKLQAFADKNNIPFAQPNGQQ